MNRPMYKYKIRYEDYDGEYINGSLHKTSGGIYLILCDYFDGAWVEVDQWDTDPGWSEKNTEVIEQISAWEDEAEKMDKLHGEAHWDNLYHYFEVK